MSLISEGRNVSKLSKVSKARREFKIVSLIYHLRELTRTRDLINNLEFDIQDLIKQYKSMKLKRNRLIKQNFAASSHLDKTHQNYWRTLQSVKELMDQKSIEKKKLITKFTELKSLIGRLKDTVYN